nr:MAG TPA_asm: hypothetical protein [Caudoviricetes sp.]
MQPPPWSRWLVMVLQLEQLRRNSQRLLKRQRWPEQTYKRLLVWFNKR